MKELPSICKEHPNAEIRHEWDQTTARWGNGVQGNPLNHNHHYYCNECGFEVCSPEEFEKRKINAN